MGIRFIALVVMAGGLTGCATKPRYVSPEEFSSSQVVRAEARQLRAGDDIELAVELNGKKEVPATKLELGYNGSVQAPLIGDVALDGKTLAEARTVLEAGYARIFVTAPLVSLRMADDKLAGEWGYVTVLGQVRNPGRFPVASIAGMNLSDALHEAGGFERTANMKSVVVTRKAEDDQLLQCVCDITQLGRAGSRQQDLVLFDGDIVQVPERLF